MKTKNTVENKAKFFALYWSQWVMMSDQFNHCVKCVCLEDARYIIPCYLLLQPLSSITDEDALMYDEICMGKGFWIKEAYPQKVIQRVRDNFTIYSISNDPKFIPAIAADFLRSKSYALPWMDLSVEELVEYGWVKLKNNG